MNNFALITQAVDAFDPRFTLRALRSISTIRKASGLGHGLAVAIRTAFPSPKNNARRVLEDMLPVQYSQQQSNGNGSATTNGKDAKDGESDTQIAEVWAYLGVLMQVG